MPILAASNYLVKSYIIVFNDLITSRRTIRYTGLLHHAGIDLT
jgi:hypothetical protein